MIKVKREDIIDLQNYSEERESYCKKMKELQALRRVHVGKDLIFLFENTETAQYQIQEKIFSEKIVREVDIQHEIDTYNEILGDQGELGCTLLIEIKNVKERSEKLRAWMKLPHHIFMILEDGAEVPAQFDEQQKGEGHLLPVQYLKFEVGSVSPVGVKVTLPGVHYDCKLSEVQRRTLTEDLRSDL